MLRTKIVCTIGPASREPDMLRALIEAGMDVARLNFSHGDQTYEQGNEPAPSHIFFRKQPYSPKEELL